MTGSEPVRGNAPALEVVGAAEGCLQRVHISLRLGQLVVFAGPAGSGARDLAVDVLFAESRRRFMMALSPSERGTGGGLARIEVDAIIGLPPAVHVDFAAPAPSVTVGAFLQLLGPLTDLLLAAGTAHCPDCGGRCAAYDVEAGAEYVLASVADRPCYVLAPLVLSDTQTLAAVLAEARRAGFLRVMTPQGVQRIDTLAAAGAPGPEPSSVEVVVDRVAPTRERRSRVVEDLRNARAIGRGRSVLQEIESGQRWSVNQQLTCSVCGKVHGDAAPNAPRATDAGAIQLRLHGRSMAELLTLPTRDLVGAVSQADRPRGGGAGLTRALDLLVELGVGHIELGRQLDSMAASERQRVRLAGCLANGLAGVMYVCEGMGAALHPDDADSWTRDLGRLVDSGNTVVAISNSTALAAAADRMEVFEAGRVVPHGQLGSERSQAAAPWSAGGETAHVRCSAAGNETDAHVVIPLGRLTCLTGPGAVGKTRFLTAVLVPLARAQAVPGATVQYEDHRGWQRAVELGSAARGSGGVALLDALGIGDSLARSYAQAPAALKRGYPPEWFRLDTPGGRCPTCEGHGQLRFDMEFMEDIALTCPACEGRRYKDEILEVCLRGLSMGDVLDLGVAAAARHFTRERSIHPKLQAAERCGLGGRLLGDRPERLEPAERLRLQVAREVPRARARDLYVLDGPVLDGHPADAEYLVAALRLLTGRGATVVVADHHPVLLAGADCAIDLSRASVPPGS